MSRHEDVNRTCDLLTAYEMGLLEERERALFEAHLPECPDCLDEMYAMAPATETLRRDPGGYAQAMVPARGASLLKRLLKKLFSPAGLGLAAPVAVAAVLAVVLLLPEKEATYSWSDLAVLEPAAYTRLDLRSGARSEAATLFQEGMDAYTAGHFRTAASTLDRAFIGLSELPAAQRPGGHVLDQVALYRGVSHLMAGHDQQAVATLEQAAGSALSPIAERAAWYLAQAHLAGGRPEAAGQELQKLLNSPVYGEQAQEQLEQIERRRISSQN